MVESTESRVVKKKSEFSQEEKNSNLELIKKKKKEDSKMVHGIIKNHEEPGGKVEFSEKYYPGDPIITWKFDDGEECDIPLRVAKHINRSCKEKKKKMATDPVTGLPIIVDDVPRQRYSFISSDFQ